MVDLVGGLEQHDQAAVTVSRLNAPRWPAYGFELVSVSRHPARLGVGKRRDCRLDSVLAFKPRLHDVKLEVAYRSEDRFAAHGILRVQDLDHPLVFQLLQPLAELLALGEVEVV